MKLVLFVVVSLAAVAKCDITGMNLTAGDCLCINADEADVRSSACGDVIDSVGSGHCFKYNGQRSVCTLEERQDFFQINWNEKDGWLSGLHLDLAPESNCEGSTAAGEYSCQVRARGMRIHETGRPTRFDCKDRSCRNTCRGGQCVAYVTCSCKRNGRWAPNTSCWRRGRRVREANGKCNRNIAANTAIATFNSRGRYFAGHAAVFIRCIDDYTVQVYDQGCCKSIGYGRYRSSHRYFGAFATITNPGCRDRGSWSCRVQKAGSTCCPISVPHCKRASNWWEAMNHEEEEEEEEKEEEEEEILL